MKTQVFAYRGYVGIMCPKENAEGLINDPNKPGQLGIAVNAESVEFSPDAVDLLKTVERSNDDLGDVDMFETTDNKIIFGWLGGFNRVVDPTLCTGARDTNFGLIKDEWIKEIDPPGSFKVHIDTHLDEEPE